MVGATKEPLEIVYQATNQVNGKRYIGVTKQGLRRRVRMHRYSANKGSEYLLHRAMRKYGIENIVFEVLADFGDDYDLAKVYEHEMICKHRPEYNLTAGGEGGGFAESTLEKMRKAKLGRKHPPEVVARRVGRKLSEAHRRNMSLAHMGRPPTKGKTGQPVPEETREKIRQTLKAAQWVDTPARIASRARTGATAASEARKIPVMCLDDGYVFDCVKAAAKFYGFDQMKLGAAIRGQKPYRGRRFERLPKSS